MLENNRKYGLWLLILAFCTLCSFASLAAEPAYSQYWYQDSAGCWHIKDGSGNPVKNAWLCDDAVASNGKNIWYLIDANGDMVSAGLVQDGTGNYYSLEMNHEGRYGMLRYESKNYTADGLTVELTLEGSHNGSFAAIKNEDGIAKLKAKYDVTKVNIDNSSCVYTSSFGGSTSGASQTASAAEASGASGNSSAAAASSDSGSAAAVSAGTAGILTSADFAVTGASVPTADLMTYLKNQGRGDTTVYFYYDSSADASRESVVKTARGITLASYRADVTAAYGSGKTVDVSSPASTKVLRAAYSADPNGVSKFVRSCLAYFTEDGKYAIYFGFKDNGQLSFIFYYRV